LHILVAVSLGDDWHKNHFFTMERIEADATPAEEWSQSLNATCNRLSTQYLNLLRAASSVSLLEEGRHDPRGT
jgi:hypothetical protein